MHPHDQLTTLVDESHQLIEDVESWNADHPDHQPLDCEFPRVMLYLSRRCLDALARGRMKEFRKWSERLVAHALGPHTGQRQKAGYQKAVGSGTTAVP